MDDLFATKDEHLHVKQTWRESNRLSAASSFDSIGSGDCPPLSPNIDHNSEPDDDFYNSIFVPALPESPAEDPLSDYTVGGHGFQVSTHYLL